MNHIFGKPEPAAVPTPLPLPEPVASPVLSKVDQADFEEAQRVLLDDLFVFATDVMGFDKMTRSLHGPACEILQDLTKKRVRIKMPRGFFKSSLCIAYIAWRICKDSNYRALYVQNNIANAQKKVSEIADHFMRNEKLRYFFPHVQPNPDGPWNSTYIRFRRTKFKPEATVSAASTRKGVISTHYDDIFEDDTVTPDLADLSIDDILPNREDIAQAIGWHKGAESLLDDANEGRIVVIGTSWADNDLLEYIEKNQPQYFSYYRAALETGTWPKCVPDVEGKSCFPEKYSTERLNEMRSPAGMGEYLFSCHMMGQPMSSRHLPFQEKWILYYERAPRKLLVYTTIDMAPGSIKGNADTDYNAVVTTGKDNETGAIYVLETWRKRCNPGELVDALFEQVDRWHPLKVGVIAVGYESSLEYWVKEKMKLLQRYFTIETVGNYQRSKDARILGLQPILKCNQMLFSPEQHEIISELKMYPKGSHDDLIDALSMQLSLWELTGGIKGVKPVGDPNKATGKEILRSLGVEPPPFRGAMDIFDGPVASPYDLGTGHNRGWGD